MKKRCAAAAGLREEKSARFFWCLVGALCFVRVEALAQAAPAPDSQEPPPGVVAIVNQTRITSQELDEAVKTSVPRLSGHGSLSESRTLEIKKQVLDDLIQKELLYQEAKRRKIQVSPDEIEAEAAKIRNRFSSEKEYAAALQKNGLTENQVRSGVERFLAVHKLTAMAVDSMVTVQDRDLAEYFQANPQKFIVPEERQLRQILIAVDPGGSEDDWKAGFKKAGDVAQKIKSGANFAEAARTYSDDKSTRERGGSLGFLPKGRLAAQELDEAAFALDDGGISPPVKTLYGYFILKVDAIKPARPLSFSEVNKAALRDQLRSQQIEKRRREWLEDLRAKAEIKVFQ